MRKSGLVWSREETLIALRIYCSLPFGKLHSGNPDIVQAAIAIGRSPSSVAMKTCNLAGLDPAQRGRVKGLKNSSSLDKQIWDQFMDASEKIATEAEEVYQRLVLGDAVNDSSSTSADWEGETEVVREVKTRKAQIFFRRAVMVSYEGRCAVSGVAQQELLIASHIIPWSVEENRRADPRNGILLNSFYDRSFDAGFITFDEDCRMVAAKELKERECESKFIAENVLRLEGQRLRMPERFWPDEKALEYHREKIFRG